MLALDLLELPFQFQIIALYCHPATSSNQPSVLVWVCVLWVGFTTPCVCVCDDPLCSKWSPSSTTKKNSEKRTFIPCVSINKINNNYQLSFSSNPPPPPPKKALQSKDDHICVCVCMCALHAKFRTTHKSCWCNSLSLSTFDPHPKQKKVECRPSVSLPCLFVSVNLSSWEMCTCVCVCLCVRFVDDSYSSG